MDVGDITFPDDPRIDERFVRRYPADDRRGAAIVVGVAHDHPASVYRVAAVGRVFAPDVLALELPGPSVPLYRLFAAGRSLPRQGGEMSAAIGAAPDATAVGIDVPSVATARSLFAGVREASLSPPEVGTVLGDVVAIGVHSARQLLAAVLLRATAMPVADDAAMVHDVSAADSPADQARDEATIAAAGAALFDALEKPAPARVLDEARERAMAARIQAHRREGTVLAVVGIDHLSGIDTALGETAQ